MLSGGGRNGTRVAGTFSNSSTTVNSTMAPALAGTCPGAPGPPPSPTRPPVTLNTWAKSATQLRAAIHINQ